MEHISRLIAFIFYYRSNWYLGKSSKLAKRAKWCVFLRTPLSHLALEVLIKKVLTPWADSMFTHESNSMEACTIMQEHIDPDGVTVVSEIGAVDERPAIHHVELNRRKCTCTEWAFRAIAFCFTKFFFKLFKNTAPKLFVWLQFSFMWGGLVIQQLSGGGSWKWVSLFSRNSGFSACFTTNLFWSIVWQELSLLWHEETHFSNC